MVAASWLTSGWIDVATLLGWFALVAVIGRRAWRRSGEAHGSAAPPRPGGLARAAGWLVALYAARPRRARSRGE